MHNNRRLCKVSYLISKFLSGQLMKVWINIFLWINPYKSNLSINLQIKFSYNIDIKLLLSSERLFHLWQKVSLLRKHQYSLCMICFRWYTLSVYFLGHIMVITSTILSLHKVLYNFTKKIWQEILRNRNRRCGHKWFYMSFQLFYQ